MYSETYEGWKNQVTWQVMINLNNEYPMYKYMIDVLKERRRSITPKVARSTAVFAGALRNLDARDTPDIDWQEIASAMNDIKEQLIWNKAQEEKLNNG